MTLVASIQRSALMSKVRHSGTALELKVRKELRSNGARFGVTGKGLPGSPDIVSLKEKWVVFVHGCFWHGHRRCGLWKLPTMNRAYWRKKFAENRRRDENVKRRLRRQGFDVLVLWGCEVKDGTKMKRKIQAFMSTAGNVRLQKR